MTMRSTAAGLAFSAAALFITPAAFAAATAAPAAPAAAPQGAPAVSPQVQYLTANLKKPGWKATPTGLQYRVVKAIPAASGAPKPAPGSVVTVHYAGTFIDGSSFDSSYERHEPATFQLANVIPGWQEGVPMMREGETWEFAIPSKLGYGDQDMGPIKAGTTLLFSVRLLWVDSPAVEAAKPAAPATAPKPAAPAAK